MQGVIIDGSTVVPPARADMFLSVTIKHQSTGSAAVKSEHRDKIDDIDITHPYSMTIQLFDQHNTLSVDPAVNHTTRIRLSKTVASQFPTLERTLLEGIVRLPLDEKDRVHFMTSTPVTVRGNDGSFTQGYSVAVDTESVIFQGNDSELLLTFHRLVVLQ